MIFLVFIKQVPETPDIRFDPQTKTIVREGVRSGINAYDRRALSEAIRYRKENGGEVVVATMGPAQARSALAEALFIGADRAIHIEDRRLAGSDTLATARVLAAVARRVEYDIIFTGQHSTDSETGQAPPELAEMLGVPCIAAVKKISYGEGMVRVESETDEGSVVQDVPLPAVFSAAERLIKPIKVKEFDPASVSGERITTLRLEELDLEPSQVGFAGSPTWVAEIREQLTWRSPQVIDGSDAAAAARRIAEEIASSRRRTLPPEVPPVLISSDREYWCLMERFQGRLRNVSLEMLAGSAALAALQGGKVCAVMMGPAPSQEDLLLMKSCGAEILYHTPADELVHPDEIVALLSDRIPALRPYAFFLPATSFGKIIAPRIAARLQLGLTGDCVGLAFDDGGNLQHWKPAFGGNIVAPIYSKTYPQMATIRPGALPAYSPRSAEPIRIVNWKPLYNVPRQYQIVERETDSGAGAARMDNARIVICAGMGLGQENVQLALRLADACNGAVGATRRVVDSGWLQRQYQVGLTGKFIAPDVYLGLGVSGRYNHSIGIQKSGKIIAVNSDPYAEIFKTADLGIVGDCIAITRALLKLLEPA